MENPTPTVDQLPVERWQRPATGARPALRMLDLPVRGDVLARRWVVVGIVGYLLLAGVFVGSLVYAAAPGQRVGAALGLLGWGPHANWPLVLLVVCGIALTLFAIWRVMRDLDHLRREEEDVEWVHTRQREGLLLVFAEARTRAKLFDDGIRSLPNTGTAVETLIDDRVRRVHAAAIEGGTVATNELQSIAEIRTLRYGSFARYASSLLLLFAVLGTFAGVKTALPGLIDAVTSATGAAISPTALSGPLSAVAGAFGGNALALIGAIAVGLMAQGLGFGRRHLLERLELVSVEYIYGSSTSADASPLQSAVTALRDTAQQFHAASGLMAGIESGLQNLSSEFSTAFESLADRLTDIASRQEEGLYEKNTAAMDELQRRVADVAKLMEANAQAHGVLVTSVRERAHESKMAIEHMRAASDRLGGTLNAVLTLTNHADSSLKSLSDASTKLVEGSEGVVRTTDALRASVEGIRPALDGAANELKESGSAIRRVADENRSAWEATAEKIAVRLREPTPVPTVPGQGGTGNQEIVTLLRRIASVSEREPSSRPSLAAAALPSLLGTLVGGGVVYLALRFL